MSIENILKEYLARYGVQEVVLNTKGFFSTPIDSLGLFSCEELQDGVCIGLFQDMPPSETSSFMHKALALVNPIENNSPYSLRPVIYESQVGIVAPIEKEEFSLSSLSTLVDMLYRTLQNAMRV